MTLRRAARRTDKNQPLLRGPFRTLFLAGMGDGVGDDIVRSLLPVVAVAGVGAGAFEVSVLNSLGMSAFLLLGVPAGVLVDRWSKKRSLVGTNLVRGTVVLSIPAAFFWGELSIWHLFLVAAVVSVADVFFTTAQSAVMPQLLRGEQLGDGYARVQSVQSGLAIASPGVVALLVRVMAAPAIFVISSAAYLYSAAMTSRLPTDKPSVNAVPEKFWSAARDGVGFTMKHQLIRPLMVSVALINAAGMFGAAAKVVFALETLQIPADQFIFLGAVSAAGGLAASAVVTRLTRSVGIGTTKISASILSAAFVVLIPAAPWLGLSAAVWVGVSGFGWSFFVILSGLAGAGIIPRLVPSALMGRAMSTYRLFTLGIMPIAGMAGGFLALIAGVVPVLWVWALIAAASAIPIAASPIRRWKQFPDDLDVNAQSESASENSRSAT